MSYVANSLYLFLSSKKPPGSLVLQLADRNSHFTRRFFHYVIFLTLPSIAGGCRCAEATTTQKKGAGSCRLLFCIDQEILPSTCPPAPQGRDSGKFQAAEEVMQLFQLLKQLQHALRRRKVHSVPDVQAWISVTPFPCVSSPHRTRGSGRWASAGAPVPQGGTAGNFRRPKVLRSYSNY